MVEYRADVPGDLPIVRELFVEYGRSIGIDLSFQGFDEELATLPGRYAPPHGTLIVARADDAPVGCVALRRIDGQTCEMKRLYVRPAARGLHIGADLARRIIQAAEARGYESMRLDTLAAMKDAVALYKHLGFREIAPYVYNPIPGAIFMEKRLQPLSTPPRDP